MTDAEYATEVERFFKATAERLDVSFDGIVTEDAAKMATHAMTFAVFTIQQKLGEIGVAVNQQRLAIAEARKARE